MIKSSKDSQKKTRYEHLSSTKKCCVKKLRCEGANENKRTTYGCINPEDSEYCDVLYQVGIWPGAGYFLDTMLVWGGKSIEEVLETAVGWCADNAPHLLVSDEDVYDIQGDYVRDAILDDPEKFGFTHEDVESVKDMSMDEICNRIGGDDVWYNLCDEALEAYGILYVDPQLYVRGENLRIEEVDPAEYPDDGVRPDSEAREEKRCHNEDASSSDFSALISRLKDFGFDTEVIGDVCYVKSYFKDLDGSDGDIQLSVEQDGRELYVTYTDFVKAALENDKTFLKQCVHEGMSTIMDICFSVESNGLYDMDMTFHVDTEEDLDSVAHEIRLIFLNAMQDIKKLGAAIKRELKG